MPPLKSRSMIVDYDGFVKFFQADDLLPIEWEQLAGMLFFTAFIL